MMLPPMTFSPPNFFTPRRRPAESRPLRDEPPAFLCAISNYLLLLRARVFGGLLGRRLLGRGLLRRGRLVVGPLDFARDRLGGGRGLLDRLRLLGLGFLHHVDALGRLDALGLVGLGLRSGFRLGSLAGLR